MQNYYWQNWYAGWGWFLWFGIWILMISNVGHWGYTYRSFRRSDGGFRKEPLDILNERYARGEILRDEYQRMKSDIRTELSGTSGNKGYLSKPSPA